MLGDPDPCARLERRAGRYRGVSSGEYWWGDELLRTATITIDMASVAGGEPVTMTHRQIAWKIAYGSMHSGSP
jgi:hypothetical protein